MDAGGLARARLNADAHGIAGRLADAAIGLRPPDGVGRFDLILNQLALYRPDHPIRRQSCGILSVPRP